MTLAIKLSLFMIFMLAKDDILSHGENTDCETANFTITSATYGAVRHYPIHRYLNFVSNKTLPPAYFCFTRNSALKELQSGNCVSGDDDLFLRLHNNNCTESWKYDPDKNHLRYKNSGYCFSPWAAPKLPQPEHRVVAGLSRCVNWNKVVLKPIPKITKMTENTESSLKPTTSPTTAPKLTITTMNTEASVKPTTSPTKGQSFDSNSNNMSISLILYIFLPMVLLALIIVMILLVRKNRAAGRNNSSSRENNKETGNQDNNDQTKSENDVVYTEPDQDCKLENSNHVPLFLNGSDNVDYINEQIITTPQIFSVTSQDYVIPNTKNGETEKQDNNDQTISENDEYTELDHNCDPEHPYISLIQS